MGVVAISYFFATAFAMAIACCGPDPRAKLCSAYLMCSWCLSNHIFQTNSRADTIESFFFMDALASMIIYLVMLMWPSRWLALLLAALGAQVVMEGYYQLIAPESRNDYGSFLVNNLLYILQLIAVVLPTLRRMIPRRRPPPERAVIPPPYEGWEPPAVPQQPPPPHEPWQPDQEIAQN